VVYFRDLYQKLVIADGHCDTILDLYKNTGRSFWTDNPSGHLDWPKLKAAKLNLQFLALYIEPQYKPNGALCRVLELLAYFDSLRFEKDLSLVLTRQDLNAIAPHSECRFLLAIEGGEALEGNLGVLSILFRLGFRSLTLTWNQRNCLADGAWEEESRGGLTSFGKSVIKEMNRLGMLIDVSHLSSAGFWDVLALTDKPIAATHSCCAALCKHPRNLSDQQLLALRNNNGIIGINFYPDFLGSNNATVETAIEHIEHAVSVTGPDCVGIGSDFDGIDKTPGGLEDITKLPHLAEAMIRRGWKEEDIGKVLGGNFMRVLHEVLPDA